MGTGEYADFFNHDTAEVEVVIEVDQSIGNPARRQLQLQGNVCETVKPVLRAHAIILMRHSPVWKFSFSKECARTTERGNNRWGVEDKPGGVEQAELERWQNIGETKRITMMVEEGEEAAAYKLVQCLYTKNLPDIETEGDLRMTLGILMIADQYQVTDALSLCATKLEWLTDLGAISWELADRVMQLPAGYLEKPGISSLLDHIQEKILQHATAEPSLPGIGLDLEVVMRNSALEERLMALPLGTCASLLSDDRCRVASENTVAAAVVRRVDHEPRKRQRSADGDAAPVLSETLRSQTMGDVIRVPHLSPLFAAAMPTFAKQLTTVLRNENYALARELDRLPTALQTKSMKDPSIPTCWLSERRPPSTVTALEFDWQTSTAELAQEFDSGKTALAGSPKHFFAGLDWGAQVQAKSVPDNEGRTLSIMFYCRYHHRPQGPRWGATVKLSICSPDGKSEPLHQHSLCGANAGGGTRFDLGIPPMQKWDQSRMQQWTSSNGFLTFRVKVSDVL